MLPKDPIMLLSTVNTKLRDHHTSLEDMCLSLGCNPQDIIDRLQVVDYHYNRDLNQFK